MMMLIHKLISYRNIALPTVAIQICSDGDTCTTRQGGKIRLACFETTVLRGKKSNPILANASKDYLNDLIAGSKITIKRITKERYGTTVAELFKGSMNIQEQLVKKDFAHIYEGYSGQREWRKQ